MKRKRGRPMKSDSERMDAQLLCKVTRAFRKSMLARARALKLSDSALMRDVLENYMREPVGNDKQHNL